MLQYFIYLMLIMNTMLFMIMNHPLSMGLILMAQTLLIALLSGTWTFMFWFSYSLFLIFMGGMLVLFMYMTSLASNETFKLNLNFKMIIMKLFIVLLMTLFLYLNDYKSMTFLNNKLNSENTTMNNLMLMLEHNNILLNKMFNYPTNMITILLINYLFLTLIATVKITNIFKGPIRQKNIN